MSNDGSENWDLATKLRHLKNTHPDEIFGVLRGRLQQPTLHEQFTCSILGAAVGALAVDAKWTDDQVIAFCLTTLHQIRIAADDPAVIAKLQDAMSAAANAKPAS